MVKKTGKQMLRKAMGMKDDNEKEIETPKKEIVKEHSHLVKVLKKGKKSELKKEARKQAKELKNYKKK